MNDRNTQKVINPSKNKSPYGWHFEQNVYSTSGIARALKAGGESGNIPKILFKEYYSVEDGNENCIKFFRNMNDAIQFCNMCKLAKEVFKFMDDELVGCIYKKG